MGCLAGRTVLVTGASSGIGRACAIAAAAEGAQVVLSGRNMERLQQTEAALASGDHLVVACDLTDEEQLMELAAAGPALDGVVHSAGAVRPFPVRYIRPSDIETAFAINYRGPVRLTAALLRARRMAEGASVVFVSSISSRFAYKGGALYSASKAALESFSRNLAIEHAHRGLRANVIRAGMVRTPMFDTTEAGIGEEAMRLHEQRYPLGFGEPEDVAEAAVFLLSSRSRWITGTELVLDGGLTAGQ